jgi:hypothetical protein
VLGLHLPVLGWKRNITHLHHGRLLMTWNL